VIVFLLLISVMALLQHPFWSRYVGGMTAIKYVGVCCVVYALLHVASRRRIPRYLDTWQSRGIVLLCVIACLSSLMTGAAFSWEANAAISYASFAILFLITRSVVDSLRRVRYVLLAMVGSIGWASLYVLREWQKYHNLYADFRPGWVVGDANYFSVSALISIPIAFCLLVEKHPLWVRVFCLSCLMLSLAAVTVSASRGGFLGLVSVFMFLVAHSRGRRCSLALAGILMLPLSFLMPVSSVARLLHPKIGDIAAENLRKDAWRAGFRMIELHPLVGVGLDNFKSRVNDYAEDSRRVDHIAHNAYIEIAAEMGLPALTVFLLILWMSYRSLDKVRRRTHSGQLLNQGALSLQASLVGCAVAICFVSGQYTKFLWLLVSLSACFPAILKSGCVAPKEQSGTASCASNVEVVRRS
jgi:O-antigen ligase